MKTLYSKYSKLVIVLIAAVLIVAGFAFTAQSSYAEDEHFTITINTLQENPFAEKHGSEFQKYTGTEFNSKYGNDIWFYDFGHGKLFINVDPNNYTGDEFYYWVTENDSDSIYSCYANPIDKTSGDYITSEHKGYKGGYSFYKAWGTYGDIDFQVLAEATLGYAKVTLEKTSYTYTGKKIKPKAVVKLDGVKLTEGVDYVVKYENNTKVGDETEVPTVIVTADDLAKPHFNSDLDATVIYEKYAHFKIVKATHPGITAKAKTATVKYKTLKKKAQTVKMSQVVAVTGKKGSLTYSISPIGSKAKKALKYKSGKITIRKGTKKGTYKFKVTVKDKGGRNYKASKTKTVTTKIRVN